MNVLFFGTPDFAVPPLLALLNQPTIKVGAVITQPDKPAGRGRTLSSSPVKSVAITHDIPVFQPQSLRRECAVLREHLAPLGPFDIGVVVAFGQILPPEVLALPTHGCLNIHASLLPRWRGAAPIQRAIEAGDQVTGVCLMHMDSGLDTGGVYSSSHISIHDSDTAGTLHDRLSVIGAELLVRDLGAIVSGSLHPIAQATEGITYATKIAPAECEIDWTSSSREVLRKIRALSPYPGAFTLWQGRRVKICTARVVPHTSIPPSSLPPGSLIRSTPQEIVIRCGDGAVSVEELQLEGKKRVSVAEFQRGRLLSEGTRFGRML